MERDPKRAITPDNGTSTDAAGTPCDAAKAMVCLAMCVKPAIRKISTKDSRPRKITGAETELVLASERERFGSAEAVAMEISFCSSLDEESRHWLQFITDKYCNISYPIVSYLHCG